MGYVESIKLVEAVSALRAGRRDLVEHIGEVCDRIVMVEPHVQALLPEADRRARLLREAAALQACYPEPEGRPPLYGALVGIKDIFRVEGFPIKAGSTLPAELFAGGEASSVRALRTAGALIVGKTVTTEFAYFEPGPTRNPHNLAHTPGGSSSGSAAAVAAGLCPLAIGTQTVGSVIRPAAFCGIVGFKPSYGRIPLDGVIPFAVSADHVGLFTADAASMLMASSVLCPGWKLAAVSAAASRRPVLGIPDGPYLRQAEDLARVAFEAQVARLEGAGYAVRPVSAFWDIEGINRRHQQLISGEVAEVHRHWFAGYEALYRPRTASIIRDGQKVSADELNKAREGQMVLRDEVQQLMGQAGIDLWICPAATGPAPEGIGATGNPIMNLPWTHTGLPALTVPAGQLDGLPLGLQCVAAHGADEHLLAWAEGLATAVA